MVIPTDCRIRICIALVLVGGWGARPAMAEPVYFTSGSAVKTWDPTTGVTSLLATYSDRLLGLNIDTAGNVITATDGGEVVKLEPNGAWSVVCAGLDSPNWVVSYGSTIYVSHRWNRSITKIEPSGEATEFATLPDWITGLADDMRGNLYATSGKKIVRISSSGAVTEVADFTSLFDPRYQYFIEGVTVGRDGTLYAVRNGDVGYVYSVDAQGHISFVGGHSSGLPYAQQVVIDDTNRIFVWHAWSPYVAGSQISVLSANVSSLGGSGFSIGGMALASAAVPEPTASAMLVTAVSALGLAAYLSRVRGDRFIRSRG